MNYITIRKLIISNILVSGLLIFSGIIFGMQKELKISKSLVVSQDGLYRWTDNRYQPIKPDGNMNENISINRSSDGNILIKEKDKEERQITTGCVYSALIVCPGATFNNGVVDENCYLKVFQQYMMKNDDNGNPNPGSGSYSDIKSFLVRTEFTKEQIAALVQTRMHGQSDGSVCAFDQNFNRYAIGGHCHNLINRENLYIYCFSSNNYKSIQSDGKIIDVLVDSNCNNIINIQSCFMARMVSKEKTNSTGYKWCKFSIEPEHDTIKFLVAEITDEQFKTLADIILNSKGNKNILVSDRFNNWYQIISTSISKVKSTVPIVEGKLTNEDGLIIEKKLLLKDKVATYTVSKFIQVVCAGIGFAAIIAAFFLYVNGLGVK